MAEKKDSTMKQTLKSGTRAVILTLCALGLAYGAVKSALGAGKVYHRENINATQKTTRVGLLVFSALFLGAMSGLVIDIGVDIRRQKQALRRTGRESRN